MSDTIYATATANGRSGVAIIRISGPNTVDILTSLTRKKNLKAPVCKSLHAL